MLNANDGIKGGEQQVDSEIKTEYDAKKMAPWHGNKSMENIGALSIGDVYFFNVKRAISIESSITFRSRFVP